MLKLLDLSPSSLSEVGRPKENGGRGTREPIVFFAIQTFPATSPTFLASACPRISTTPHRMQSHNFAHHPSFKGTCMKKTSGALITLSSVSISSPNHVLIPASQQTQQLRGVIREGPVHLANVDFLSNLPPPAAREICHSTTPSSKTAGGTSHNMSQVRLHLFSGQISMQRLQYPSPREPPIYARRRFREWLRQLQEQIARVKVKV